MKRVLVRILTFLFGQVPASWLEGVLLLIVRLRAASLSPDEALRFLFRLEAGLYPLAGQKAVEYGGGLHTKHRHIRYHDFFVARVKRGERILDIGCGNGALAHDIAERAGARVLGIDTNPENISGARQRFRHPDLEFRAGDALQDLPEGPFDVVILSNILEHLPERSRFLRRVQDSARSSRILIRVPLFERDWRVPLKRELGVEWRLDPTHETEYTLESFAEETAAGGLKIVHQEVRWGEIWAEMVPDGGTRN